MGELRFDNWNGQTLAGNAALTLSHVGALAKIKAAFRAEWERRVHRRRANSHLPWAIAASVLLALGLRASVPARRNE